MREIADHVRYSFSQQGLMSHLAARLVEASTGRCVIEVPWATVVLQQHGYFHGGTCAAIADTAGGYAALSLAPHGAQVLTVEFKINFLRPAQGELIRATANVINAGRSLVTVRSQVEAVSGGNAAACCELLGTMSIKSPAAEVSDPR